MYSIIWYFSGAILFGEMSYPINRQPGRGYIGLEMRPKIPAGVVFLLFVTIILSDQWISHKTCFLVKDELLHRSGKNKPC